MRRLPPGIRTRVGDDRSGSVVLVAAAVGLVVRLAASLAWSRTPQNLHDPTRYLGYANSIAHGNGLADPFVFHLTGDPTAYFPPGYPFALGGLQLLARPFGLEDSFPEVIGVMQSVLGAVIVVLVGMLGRRIAGGPAGALAAVVVALYPNLVLHATVALSETLAITVMLGFLLVALPDEGAPLGRGQLVGAGVLLGTTILVRPVIGGVLAAVVVAWAVDRVGWRELLRRTAVVTGVGILCVVPWTIRNAVRMDAFVPLSTNNGENICIGNAPGATGGFAYPPDCDVGFGIYSGKEDEVEADTLKREIGLRSARERWRDQPGLVADRFRYMVEHDHDGARALESYGTDPWMSTGLRDGLWRISDAAWIVVGLLGLAGMVRLVWTRRPVGLAVVVSALAVFAVPLATFGDARFKVPAVPLLALAAAALVTTLARRSAAGDGGRG